MTYPTSSLIVVEVYELTSIAKLKGWTYPTSSLVVVEVHELTSMAELEKKWKSGDLPNV